MASPDYLVREYRDGDAPAVEQCLAELQDFSRDINPNAAAGTIAPRYLGHLLSRCAETAGKIFVAESEGRIVGAVCIFARVKSDAVDEDDYEYAHISDLVIIESRRGKGLGRALLRRAEEHARSEGATLLRIGVLARNEVARNLYLRCGFDELFVMLQKKL